jgi:4-hydroxy-tetrahydrodipicolinate synthase
VLSGDDALLLPLVAAGGDGVISVVSNVAPTEVAEMTNAALRNDFETTRKLHYRLLPFMKAAFIETNPGPIKFALAKKGLPAGALRLPLVRVMPASEKLITEAMFQSELL